MRTTFDVQARPQPSAGGWEAYRFAAMAIIEQEKRARELSTRMSNEEANDAKRGN